VVQSIGKKRKLGALTVGTAVAAGINPYVVMIDPSGRFAYALNAVFSTISVYKIEATGALTAVPE
jgi:6-phosphogluconolactonase (cycloisomerase 2 family)